MPHVNKTVRTKVIGAHVHSFANVLMNIVIKNELEPFLALLM